MGGPEFSQGYGDQLKTDILEQFDHFQKHNESKNIFKAAMTPAVLFTVMLLAYIIAGVFNVIGLESIANMLNFVMVCFLVLLCTWFYLQYSGELRNVAVQIDSLATAIWEHVSTVIFRNIEPWHEYFSFSIYSFFKRACAVIHWG